MKKCLCFCIGLKISKLSNFVSAWTAHSTTLPNFEFLGKPKRKQNRRCVFSPAVGVEIHNRDSTRTPGQRMKWLRFCQTMTHQMTKEGDMHVWWGYDEDCFTHRTKKGKHVSVRLSKEWEEAAANEKSLCLDHVEEACRTVCIIIAPRDNE